MSHAAMMGWHEGRAWAGCCEMCGGDLGQRLGPRCPACEETYEADGGDTMHDDKAERAT